MTNSETYYNTAEHIINRFETGRAENPEARIEYLLVRQNELLADIAIMLDNKEKANNERNGGIHAPQIGGQRLAR